MVKTPTDIVELVDQLLEHHIYDEIAGILNARGEPASGRATARRLRSTPSSASSKPGGDGLPKSGHPYWKGIT
jgi:hypothetical protein